MFVEFIFLQHLTAYYWNLETGVGAAAIEVQSTWTSIEARAALLVELFTEFLSDFETV